MKETTGVQKIYEGLVGFHGALSEVARRSGVTRQYVTMVMKGQRIWSDTIVLNATIVLEERIARRKMAEASVTEVIKKHSLALQTAQ